MRSIILLLFPLGAIGREHVLLDSTKVTDQFKTTHIYCMHKLLQREIATYFLFSRLMFS